MLQQLSFREKGKSLFLASLKENSTYTSELML